MVQESVILYVLEKKQNKTCNNILMGNSKEQTIIGVIVTEIKF